MSEGLAALKGLARGFYPERRADDASRLDRAVSDFLGRAARRIRAVSPRFGEIAGAVNDLGRALTGIGEEELGGRAEALRRDFTARGFDRRLVAFAFALVREVAARRIGLRHFDVQLAGGWALLNGKVAEMETGEGKTLVATLPACTAALAGIPVHVITVNDYLARRDAEWMGPVYEALGLRVGVVTQGMSIPERRAAYRCDVTYCTNKELTFDYLKDRLLLGRWPGPIQARMERMQGAGGRIDRLALRGLYFAIVDEADSVLIDEARTPLIISGRGDDAYEARVYRDALDLAERLEPGEDYTVDESARSLRLTEAGKARLEELAGPLGGLWNSRRWREELSEKALTARALFRRDRDYLVRDGKVQIVDEYTGRLMPDRSWEQGLHQMIEVKEGCETTARTETLARTSYQRFFRRYLHLAGMTGTAREVADELWSVYRLEVVRIPTNRPVIRKALPARVYRDADAKWAAVVARIRELHDRGRPVLIGTRSVAASEFLGVLLDRAGLPYRLLNARQDKEEAGIVAEAGRRSQITVATNMAGRGTDIALGPEVRALGGLHVIATERHDARRIDRQLFGRCGRQGDPGSYEVFAALDDEILMAHLGAAGKLLGRFAGPGRLLGRLLARRAQRRAERRHFLARRDLMRIDDAVENTLAFSGRGE